MTSDRDWLEHALEQGDDIIEDGGFTDRVLEALPPPRARQAWRTPILLGSAVLGCLVAFVWGPGAEFLVDAVAQAVAFGESPSPGAVPLVALAVLALVVGGAAAATIEV